MRACRVHGEAPVGVPAVPHEDVLHGAGGGLVGLQEPDLCDRSLAQTCFPAGGEQEQEEQEESRAKQQNSEKLGCGDFHTVAHCI